MSLRKIGLAFAFLNIAAVALLSVFYFMDREAGNDRRQALINQHYSYLLADELRQSSDDLTRLARTYVVTGQATFEQQYMDILDIRNGKKPRPEAYHRIYWDFVAAGNQQPRPPTKAVPLLKLMEDAGFTAAEFEQLKKAKDNSDGLVNLEVEAMNLVKGLDKTGKVKVERDWQKAVLMLHSEQYHTFKGQIMAPVDAFFILLEKRTNDAIDAAHGRKQRAELGLLVTILITVLSIVSTVALFFRSILQGISTISGSMMAIAQGSLEAKIAYTTQNNELGDMARALETLRHNSKAKMEMDEANKAAEAGEHALSASRLNRRQAFESDVVAHVAAFEASVKEMQSAAEALMSGTSVSAEKSLQSIETSLGARNAVNGMASSCSQLSSAVQDISSQVEVARGKLEQAADVTTRTGGSIAALDEMAQQIGAVIALIENIASQTNLLALNATIEAARAGDSGKGFAVVAAEVKALASQTAQATEDIRKHVGSIQGATSDTVGSISEIEGLITELNQFTKGISNLVSQQADATQEIAKGATVSAEGVAELNDTMSELGATSAENRDAAERMHKAADRLQKNVGNLQGTINRFVTDAAA